MIHDFPALVAFARENREGLLQIKELENAKKVLDLLAEEGMSPQEILIRAINSKFRNELFDFLVDRYHASTEWATFQDAVIASYNEWGENSFSWASLCRFFSGHVDDQEALIRRHRNVLLDESLPFLSAMDPDKHWHHKVCWYITSGNLDRAWEELKRASRGLHVSDSYTPEELLRGDAHYAFEVTAGVLKQLAADLFTATSKKFDIFLDDDERQAYPLRVLRFNPSARGMLLRVSYKVDSVVMVPKVGAQIALISRHFASRERERRREKVLGKMRQA